MFRPHLIPSPITEENHKNVTPALWFSPPKKRDLLYHPHNTALRFSLALFLKEPPLIYFLFKGLHEPRRPMAAIIPKNFYLFFSKKFSNRSLS